MNEGHAALLALERIRGLVGKGSSFAEAHERVRSSTVFTTHTPVAAGHDVFERALVERYLGQYVRELGLVWDELAALAREAGGGRGFGMTPLALRTAAHVNGVSELHGRVSRRMWRPLWPGLDDADVPIAHVTNGVHPRTWLGAELGVRLGGVWELAYSLAGDELRAIHRERKGALLGDVAERDGTKLDPAALTIGFARRFATYKRADLLLSERERLSDLLGDAERPVQILVAGKAHPADDAGKGVLQHVAEFARSSGSRGRFVFLEGYDLALARLLVQGCDVWLNTPVRPLEASGTSGMKAGMNGVLNVSILDGWWYEGYSPDLGWAIGGRDPGEEELDKELLFSVLESEVIPCFYDEPERWTEMMRASIANIGARFNSDRMVREYVDKLYLPAHRAAGRLAEAAA
jgi:starch phosphorylase